MTTTDHGDQATNELVINYRLAEGLVAEMADDYGVRDSVIGMLSARMAREVYRAIDAYKQQPAPVTFGTGVELRDTEDRALASPDLLLGSAKRVTKGAKRAKG